MAFSDGVAAVQLGDKCVFVDRSGDVVFQTDFDTQDPGNHIRHFSQGLAPVEVDDKWGFVDKTGRFAISPQFTEAGHFSLPDRPFHLRNF
jgi:hypothetical protein